LPPVEVTRKALLVPSSSPSVLPRPAQPALSAQQLSRHVGERPRRRSQPLPLCLCQSHFEASRLHSLVDLSSRSPLTPAFRQVDNLNTGQLNIGIWSGDVKLRNLRLKKEALDKFRLPVDVVEGYLGDLTLSIPW
jgi:hypothetical protein